jgi:hypothetical protein
MSFVLVFFSLKKYIMVASELYTNHYSRKRLQNCSFNFLENFKLVPLLELIESVVLG